MTSASRYDRAPLRAKRTDEGYLIDTPVVGRVGIQTYINADGTKRREFRPPEEVFHADSLASFAGKPITDDHPSVPVTSANAKSLAIGFMSSEAKQDGDDVLVPIIVHDGAAIDKALKGNKRELSLGYKVDLEETPGEWNGQKYDAIQRNIRINHLALVPRGRAGNARLNLDRHDAVSTTHEEDFNMSDNLSRVRLDSGLEYPAAPEVALAIEKMRSDNATLTAKLAEADRRADALTGQVDTLKAQAPDLAKVRADALEAARAELKVRAALEKVAADFKVDAAGKTDREVREAVIKTHRADADLAGKSEDYIAAAFDTTVAMKADMAMAAQRATVHGRKDGDDAKPAKSTYAAHMASLGKSKE